ncbi:MAG: hypothetical protein ACM30E_03795 [Nitrososphaerales archaeon]
MEKESVLSSAGLHGVTDGEAPHLSGGTSPAAPTSQGQRDILYPEVTMRRLSGTILILVLAALFASGCAPAGMVIPTPAAPTPAAGLPNPTSEPAVTPSPIPSAAAAGSSTAAPPTAIAATALPVPDNAPAMPSAIGAETYTSEALGIRFSYLPRQNGQLIKVLEQGDKVYVYPVNMEPTAGQWVQVFEKRPDESLVHAITRLIMPGHPTEDCQVVPVAGPTGSGSHPANYEYAGIVVRRAPGEDDAAVLPRWRTCPQPYTVVGGIGYFQADSQHPDKFLFLSIGQYGILAGKDVPWQATIAFE